MFDTSFILSICHLSVEADCHVDKPFFMLVCSYMLNYVHHQLSVDTF